MTMTAKRRLPSDVLLLAGLFLVLTRASARHHSFPRTRRSLHLGIFASLPLVDIFTSYHLPNNHILHTLCVRAATNVLGDAEWSLRLPALLAGVLAVPILTDSVDVSPSPTPLPGSLPHCLPCRRYTSVSVSMPEATLSWCCFAFCMLGRWLQPSNSYGAMPTRLTTE